MCGIWGVLSKRGLLTSVETDRILSQLLIAGNLRGTHGAGLFSIHDDFSTKTTKKAGNSFRLLFSKEYEAHEKEIVKKIFVPSDLEYVTDEYIKENEKRDERIESFVELIATAGKLSLSFEDNLNEAIEKKVFGRILLRN